MELLPLDHWLQAFDICGSAIKPECEKTNFWESQWANWSQPAPPYILFRNFPDFVDKNRAEAQRNQQNLFV